VHVEIGDEVTQDVHAGLRLYADATHRSDSARVQEWLYWLNQNPFGKGVYAVAKHGDDVVGFYALIPVEMRLGDRAMRGAKGEFFAVAPAFRNALVGQRALRVPYALSCELHGAAAGFGIDCIALVATGAAAICHAISGAKTMTYEVDEYRLLFRGSLWA